MEESDRNKPVVDIEIRNEVVRSDLGEASVVSPNAKDGSEDGDSGIGGEDLLSVSLVEDDGVRVKVVGELGIVLLSRGVPDQVHRPSEELLSDQVDHDVKRSVSDSLGELGLLLLGDVHAINVFLCLVERGVAMLVSGSRNEDLISGEVAGSGVMSTVRDSPAVVRDADGRVKNPSDSIVDGSGGGERLVPALVSDDPETSTGETSGEPVSVPEGEGERF